MKHNLFATAMVAFLCSFLTLPHAAAQLFEQTFGAAANHEAPQDGKPIPNGRYIVLSNTLSYGPANRILLTRLNANGSVGMNVSIQHNALPSVAYYGSAIELDYSATGAHTGYFIAGSRSTANGKQAILIRTNTSGTVSWVKVLPNADNNGSLDESGVSVERQSNGDVIMTASGYSAAAGNHRFSVSRFSSAGIQLWSHRYYAATTGQSFEATEACNAVRSGVNVVVVTGRFWNGAANPHTFLSCIDASNGNEIWRRSYDSGLSSDMGADVVYKPANGLGEPAALMVVGSAGLQATTLWVIRANPLNGIASSKIYAPSIPGMSFVAFRGQSICLDVTGTKAAITGNIISLPTPGGNNLNGTYAMVLPFYGTELPDWSYYYRGSETATDAPRSISYIKGINEGYFVTCGKRLDMALFNDAHNIRINSLGSNGQGCDLTAFSVTRTPQGSSAWREFNKALYTWTNVLINSSPQSYFEEACDGSGLNDDGTERSVENLEDATMLRVAPNPVAPGNDALLRFKMMEAGQVSVQVYDLAGRAQWSANSVLEAGEQVFTLPASQWPKGAYFIRLQTPDQHQVLKLLVSGN